MMLTWTSEPPTEPGLYLLVLKKSKPRAVTVYNYCDDLCFDLSDKDGTSRYNVHFVRFFDPQWFGPIPEPEEA